MMVAAGSRQNNGEGSNGGADGREGRNAFGEDVIPGTGLGPGLHGVEGSLDGGLAGLPESTSAGEDVLEGKMVTVGR